MTDFHAAHLKLAPATVEPSAASKSAICTQATRAIERERHAIASERRPGDVRASPSAPPRPEPRHDLLQLRDAHVDMLDDAAVQHR